jgi:hypothetical protein
MITLIGLLVTIVGVWELVNNKKIARRFDSQVDGFQSTSRQNITGIGFVTAACGLALVFIA